MPSLGPVGFELALPTPSTIQVGVFDVQGRRLRDLAQGTLDAGIHTFTWDGRDAAGGVASTGPYFIRMTAGGESRTVKVIRAE
jgi:flagellar basal-body rod modification protein FlgD